ncbi:CDP-alcohol phosphatidyltransferase family protein [Azospirillum picis]|uniref:Phosphatidylglycerophosphate synthase n=1 Tax=Azospirillum picis TaxID=488438 RepID=A0ABU0MJH6_9PROT|nr:CDP-alcohol phosphatidyltransferase family protein [Azospirillum picis]MBP2299821.1 phosphatidylglycerophosphate synthase [Azospirillum picis]MDQ0533617.1 phosphatidylglycerophosphate synthase [Azospirillum picis]
MMETTTTTNTTTTNTNTAGAADRRPIATRSARWAQRLAAWLTTTPVTPNQISLLSAVCAAFGGALLLQGGAPAWIGAALCVQLRLLCNLLDGMVAVEGGKGSPVGALYNEFPDRVADTAFLVPLGYAAGVPWLGWAAALAAMMTAYVRTFGGALGLVQDFGGVMAKQRRMAALTVALIAQAVEHALWGTRFSLLTAAWIIMVGSLLTVATRTLGIARSLKARNPGAIQPEVRS